MELDINHLFFWDPIALEGTPLAINRIVLLMFVASLLCMLFFWLGARRRALVPKGVQNLSETAYLFVRNNIAIDVIGTKEGPKYADYLAALFYFIFFMNLLEIVPGINFPVTSRMAIPAALAILTYVIFVFIGFKKHGLRYIKDTLFPPGLPGGFMGIIIKLLLAIIELFSVFVIRPITLAIRLLANMMAGHVLLTIFFLFTHQFLVTDPSLGSIPLGIVTMIVAAGLIVFELLVIAIQAYIFTMLTAFYIAESIEGHGDHEEHGAEAGHGTAQHETEVAEARAPAPA